MKKRIKVLLGVALGLSLVTGGVMAVQNDPKPVSKVTKQEDKKVEAAPVVEAPVVAVTESVAQTVQAPATPQPDAQCLADKAAALVPLQARMSDLRTKYLDNPERLEIITKTNYYPLGWPGQPNYHVYYQRTVDMFQVQYDKVKAEYDAKAAEFNC